MNTLAQISPRKKATSEFKNGDQKVTRRYNFALPGDLYDELQKVADSEGVTFVDVLRKFVKIGLVMNNLTKDGKTKLLIRENNVDREIVLL